MPYQQTRAIEDIKAHGTNICGVKEIDKSAGTELYNTMLTPAQMAEYYREGVPIRVIKYADIEEIYEAISQHIHAWKNRLEKGINIGGAPIDDLILLDRFANTIYDKAKYQFTPEIADSLVGKSMSDLQRVNVHNFFDAKVLTNILAGADDKGVTRINADKEEELPDRESLGEFFKTRLSGLRRY
jgi:glutamate synthase domain-containing protein 2